MNWSWLKPWMGGVRTAANVHAGFDETSALLRNRYPEVAWLVLDFYDPVKHTEISIKRARKVCPPEPGTLAISSQHLLLENQSLDLVVLILAAHEVRDHHERVTFFHEIHRVLRDNGRVIVTEHLRDWQNILAYTIGAWHFHPRSEWLATFDEAGFSITSESREHPLITTLILGKYEPSP